MKNLIGILLFLLIFIIAISAYKNYKDKLAKFYGVSKPTLQNWVEHFQTLIDPEEWKKKRTINIVDEIHLKMQWGSDASLVLGKTEIAERGSASLKMLSKIVGKNLDKIGITAKAWKKCKVFPPAVSQRIIDLLIGKEKVGANPL